VTSSSKNLGVVLRTLPKTRQAKTRQSQWKREWRAISAASCVGQIAQNRIGAMASNDVSAIVGALGKKGTFLTVRLGRANQNAPRLLTRAFGRVGGSSAGGSASRWLYGCNFGAAHRAVRCNKTGSIPTAEQIHRARILACGAHSIPGGAHSPAPAAVFIAMIRMGDPSSAVGWRAGREGVRRGGGASKAGGGSEVDAAG